MHLTESWLRSQSTPASFERGLAYFEQGRILSLTTYDGFYRGQVMGSEPYAQLIDLREVPPSLTCTCPYSSGGYCKHLIAVGLAIIEGQFTQPTNFDHVRTHQAAPIPSETVDHWWEQMPDAYKLQFLREGIRVYPDWARAFVDYMDTRRTPALYIELERTRDEIQTAIQALAPHPDSLSEGYMEHEAEPWEADIWEAQETEKGHQVEAALQTGIRLYRTYFAAKDWPNTLLALQAIYEAFIAMRASGGPIWEQYGEFLEQSFQSLYHRWVDQLATTLLGPPQRRWLIDQVFSRWRVYEAASSATLPAQSPRYLWPDWQFLLQVLAANRAQAQFLTQKLDAHSLQDDSIAPLRAYLQRVLEAE